MKILELFCGVGGWSKGFHDIFPDADFYGVDIKNYGYPYNFIKADLNDWEPKEKYDIVLASPACSEFSNIKRIPGVYHYSERIGLDLVWRAFHLVEKINPKFWVIENVPGLAEFLPKPNEIVAYNVLKHGKKAYLWGNFPTLGFFEECILYKAKWGSHGHHATRKEKLERGLIPLALSRQMAKKMKEKINGKFEALNNDINRF